MDTAFKYIAAGHPLMTEADYPYRGVKGTCQYDASKGKGKVTKYTDVLKDSAT